MSFLSDLVEGNFGNLGTDIEHAPSSLIAHPDELAETLGATALIGGGFLLGPEIAGAFGAGDAALGAADLGVADATFGAFDPALFAANSADVAAGGLGADLVAGDLGLADLAGGAIDTGAFAADPAALTGDTSALFDFTGEALPDTSSLATLGSDTTGFNIPGETFDATAGDTALPANATISDIAPGTAPGAPGAAPTGAGATTTPAGFAPTDAELAGATTGAAAPGAGPSLTTTLGGYLNSSWTRLAAGLAPLALTLGMGQPGLPAAAQQLQGQATALSQQGQADLAAARAGQLNPGQTATIGAMQQDLTNQWRQTLYNQGVKDITKDSRWPQIQALIDQQVTAATTSMIQQNINTALAETGQASQALTAIANMQMQSDLAFTNNLVNATKALGLIAGSTKTTTTTVTT